VAARRQRRHDKFHRDRSQPRPRVSAPRAETSGSPEEGTLVARRPFPEPGATSCEANSEQGSAPTVTEGINRRTLATAGVAAFMCTFAGAQDMPPTPDDLERELPSPRKARPIGAALPELPHHSQLASARACSRVSGRRTSRRAARGSTSSARAPGRLYCCCMDIRRRTWPGQGRARVDGQLYGHRARSTGLWGFVETRLQSAKRGVLGDGQLW
jgi:hypothetical protein